MNTEPAGTCGCGNPAIDQSTCNECDLIEWTECPECGFSLADDEECPECEPCHECGNPTGSVESILCEDCMEMEIFSKRKEKKIHPTIKSILDTVAPPVPQQAHHCRECDDIFIRRTGDQGYCPPCYGIYKEETG